MLSKRRILFTGGGTAGHVIPAIPIIKACLADGWDVFYIGSETGIERQLVAELNVPYYPIQTGRLRRYLTWRNLIDPFRVIVGFFQAWYRCFCIKPQVIFSKGGFVAVPVVLAGWMNRVPIIAHECDLTPGLANRLTMPFIHRLCVSFPMTTQSGASKRVYTGNPIRADILKGSSVAGKKWCGFQDDKPVVLIMGGSLGAQAINEVMDAALPQLLAKFNVVHLRGKGKLNISLNKMPGYYAVEFLGEPLYDIFALADVVVSRAGANTLFELIALQKPHVLLPLSRTASRGDQEENAHYSAEHWHSPVIFAEALTVERFCQVIEATYLKRQYYSEQLKASPQPDSVKIIMELLNFFSIKPK